MQKIMENIVKEIEELYLKGNTAQYIPELAKVNPSDFGVSIAYRKGIIGNIGDYNKKFTIQSISKVITLMLALMDRGEDEVFSLVGKEPTGDPFNSIIKLETYQKKKPLNPMINAGAITITSLINGDTNEEKHSRLINLCKKLTSNNNISMNNDVYTSEKYTGDRNRALAYFLKDNRIINGEVESHLDLYFKQCAIEMNCNDLAMLGLVLSNNGISPTTNEIIIPKRIAKIAKTFMFTCGLYDGSGEFAINAGIPAKSGVGGGILAVAPDELGIGIYGPSLNDRGNSIMGITFLEMLAKELNLGVM